MKKIFVLALALSAISTKMGATTLPANEKAIVVTVTTNDLPTCDPDKPDIPLV